MLLAIWRVSSRCAKVSVANWAPGSVLRNSILTSRGVLRRCLWRDSPVNWVVGEKGSYEIA